MKKDSSGIRSSLSKSETRSSPNDAAFDTGTTAAQNAKRLPFQNKQSPARSTANEAPRLPGNGFRHLWRGLPSAGRKRAPPRFQENSAQWTRDDKRLKREREGELDMQLVTRSCLLSAAGKKLATV